MRKEVTPYAIVLAFAFGMHFVWEWLHLPLYINHAALGSGLPLVLWATGGDVAYTLGALLLVALFKRTRGWIPTACWSDYLGLGIVGFCVALLVEYKALAFHRWGYAAAMPLFLGVGVSPLLQMTVLLPLSVFAANFFLKSVIL